MRELLVAFVVSALATGEAFAQPTRPLCPYPQAATYDGKGDPSEAASYGCTPGGT